MAYWSANGWKKSLPFVDEVLYIDRIPLGCWRRLVAVPGKVIETLSNPYGIATVFNFNADDKNIVPMKARADRQPFRRGG